MSNKYYINNNDEKSYTIEELKQLDLKSDTMIYSDDMKSNLQPWTRLSEIPEIATYVLIKRQDDRSMFAILVKIIFCVFGE